MEEILEPTFDEVEEEATSQQEEGAEQTGESVETPAPEATAEAEGEQTPYTDDELQSIPVEQWEETRLTPLQKIYWKKQKDLERGYQKKFQELAQVRQQPPQQTQTQQPQPRTIEEAFDLDPQGTLSAIDDAIIKKAADDPLSPEIHEFRKKKDALMLRGMQRLALEMKQSQQAQQFMQAQSQITQEMFKAMPDLNEVGPSVVKYAIEKLGYSQEEIAALTDARYGMMAVKNAKMLYDAFKASNPVKAKKIPQKPPQTQKPGSGFKQSEPETWTEADAIKDLERSQL